MHTFRVHGLDHALRVVRCEGPEGLSDPGKSFDVKSDGDVSVQASGKVKVNGSNIEMN